MNRGIRVSIFALIIVLLSVLIYYFLKVGFPSSSKFSFLAVSIIACALYIYSYNKGNYQFILTLATTLSVFLALGVTFLSPYTGDAPLALYFTLSLWQIAGITLLISLAVLFTYEKIKFKDKYPLLLAIVFILIWIVLAFNTKFFDDWKLENYLTVPFLILFIVGHKWFKFSNLSYTLIFTFMTLHIFGSHYTYEHVPFGNWLADFLGFQRNHYDRIVHFSFGLLFAYPIREIAIRVGNLKGVWALYFPIDFVLAFSAIYELIEWGIAVIFGGDLGIAYLGSQGDIWDAQKDMFLAGLGSIITMLVVLIVLLFIEKRQFLKELISSLKIKKSSPLGENAIEKILNKKR